MWCFVVYVGLVRRVLSVTTLGSQCYGVRFRVIWLILCYDWVTCALRVMFGIMSDYGIFTRTEEYECNFGFTERPYLPTPSVRHFVFNIKCSFKDTTNLNHSKPNDIFTATREHEVYNQRFGRRFRYKAENLLNLWLRFFTRHYFSLIWKKWEKFENRIIIWVFVILFQKKKKMFKFIQTYDMREIILNINIW